MKKLVFIVLMISASGLMPGQTTPAAMQRKVEDLISRMSQLEKENQKLRSDLQVRDSMAYCALRMEIFEAYMKAPELSFDFKSTTDKIAITGLFARLMQANNPTSDILGFRFTDIIFSSCEKHFLNGIRKEKDRARFGQVISKIIDNPVVSSLANTNPFTSVIAGIVSAIAGFTTAEAELKKEGGRVREVEIKNEDVIDGKSITDFRSELQVYINFYDALIKASDRYIAGLSDLESKYANLSASVSHYLDRLQGSSSQEEGNMIATLSSLLPDPGNRSIDFHAFLVDENILRILSIAREYPALSKSVSELKKEYNALLYHFLTEYLVALESTGKFPEGIVDPARIDHLIGEITRFIESENLSDNIIQDPCRRK
jgi:hypothetical protein